MSYSQKKQGRRAHTTSFIVDGRDFFIARTDMPGVRVGMIGGTCFDVTKESVMFARLVESKTEAEAEGYFDRLMESSSG